MSWRAPTYRAARALPDNPLVRCGCGRTTNASMMLDVRALPATVRGGRDYICDGCRERMILTGRITREDLYRALGAPDTVLARVRIMDERRRGLRRG